MKALHYHFIDGHPVVDIQIGQVTYLDCEHDGKHVWIRGERFNLPLHRDDDTRE